MKEEYQYLDVTKYYYDEIKYREKELQELRELLSLAITGCRHALDNTGPRTQLKKDDNKKTK